MMTLQFERKSEKKGWFRAALITFLLTGEQGRPFGTLAIEGKEARYESGDGRESFRLKGNFWGNTWQYAGDGGSVFAKMKTRWLQQQLALPDGRTYNLKIQRRNRLFARPNIPGYLQATFSGNGSIVFTLDNLYRRKWLESEPLAPMQGTIATEVTDAATLVAMLLSVQRRIEADYAAAAAAA